MLVSSIKMLLAFYISGIAFRVFVTNIPIKWPMIKEILLLKDIPGWSEFIISFALYLLVGIYFHEHTLSFNKWILILSTFLSSISLTYILMNNGQLPERFPPSIYWIILPALPIYLYYLLGILLTEKSLLGGKLNLISFKSIP